MAKDLTPGVKYGTAGEESKREVLSHLEHCPDCKEAYDRCPPPPDAAAYVKTARALKRIKAALKVLAVTCLLLLGMGMMGIRVHDFPTYLTYYSFFAVMGAGVLTFVFFRPRWSFVLLPVVFILQYLSIAWYNWVNIGFGVLNAPLLLQLIPGAVFLALAAGFGAALAFLVRFALGRKKKTDKKNIKAILLRTLSGAGAAAILVLSAIFIGSQGGDPITSFIAEGKMRQYLSDNYGSFNLTYEGTYYAAYRSMYMADVKSEKYPDLHFSLYCFQLRTVGDNFALIVAGGENKTNRLEGGYSIQLFALLKSKTNNIQNVYLTGFAADSSTQGDALNTADALETDLTLEVRPFDFTPEAAAEQLTKYYRLLKDSGYVFRSYTLYTSDLNSQKYCHLAGVTLTDIEDGKLLDIIIEKQVHPEDSDSQVSFSDGSRQS